MAPHVDAASEVQPRKAYISIIKHLAPLDALILEKIFAVDQKQHRKAIVTHELPSRAYPAIDIDLKTLPKPSEEVQVALAKHATQHVYPKKPVNAALQNYVRFNPPSESKISPVK